MSSKSLDGELSELLRGISEVLLKAHEIETALQNFNDSTSQELFDNRLLQYQQLLKGMKDRVKARGQDSLLNGLSVPEGFLRELDAGRNPDEYLRNAFLECRRDNQISKGKVMAVDLLRTKIQEQMAQQFPGAPSVTGA